MMGLRTLHLPAPLPGTKRGPARILRMHADGRPTVDQDPCGDFDISWNPDDDRFYVHARDDEQTVVHTCGGLNWDKSLANARYWAKRHST